MRRRRAFVMRVLVGTTIAAGVFSSAAAWAEGLRWKFKSGEELHYVTDRKIVQKVDFSGSPIEIKAGMTFDITWKIKDVGADGTANMQQTIDRLQFSMESPLGGPMQFDSKKPGGAEGPMWQQLEPLVTALLGQPFSMKVAPNGKVTDIQLPEKLAAQFDAQKKPQAGPGGRRGGGLPGMGGGMFNENSIKELIQRSIQLLPEGSTSGEGSWTQNFENAMMGAGVMKTEVKYAPGGKDQADGHQVEKIVAKTELTFEPAEKSPVELEIAEQEGESTTYFDADAGRTLKVEGKQKMILEISAPNRDMRQEVEEVVTMKQGKSPDPPADDKPANDAK